MAVGHSQGGGAVWKLAESEYVKHDKDYLGTVALAPAAKFIDMFLADMDGVISSGYLPMHAKAYQRVHPSYKLTILSDIVRDRVAISDTAQLCLSALGGLSSDLTVDENVSEEGIKTDIPHLLKWQNEMAPASGGHNSQPLLVVQGLNDTAVVPSVTRALWSNSCLDGNEVHLSEYPGMNHDQVIPAGAPEWLAWMDALFAGQRTSGNCSVVQKRPFDMPHVELAPDT
jgi:pimeloyl-ACP methyl ester carboxylesterase